jgi:hypothetical protein
MRPRLPAILGRIRALATFRAVRFTVKAQAELATLRLDEEDARDVLARLNAGDFAERLTSETTGEWMYVFKPSVGGMVVYIKLVLRSACIVVSFHVDVGVTDEQAEQS